MYSLTIYLEDGVKDSCSGNFVIFAEKCPWESLRKKVTLCGISLFFWLMLSVKYDFLEIYEIFNVTNSTNLGS